MKFSVYPASNLKLKEPVLVYSDGRTYKIVRLSYMNVKKMIHDVYYDSARHDKEMNLIPIPITVIFDPKTCYSIIFFGTYNVVDNEESLLTVVSEDNPLNKIIPIKYDGTSIRRAEVKIMTLRNAISKYPDCLHLESKKIKPINNDKLDIGYSIEYISKKKGTIKRTIVVPEKNIDPYFDIQKNRIETYLDKMIEKIRDKNGVVAPVSVQYYIKLFPGVKIVEL